MNRRSFVAKSALVGMGMMTGSKSIAAEQASTREIAVFTKFLENLSFDELAATIAPLGVAGLEAPLRQGGHIEPEAMAEKLPALVEALTKKDLSVMIMASSIDSVDKKGLAENQLRSAAKVGIKRYRLQHLKYDLSKPIKPQVANFKAQLTDLAAPIWDMVSMLEEIDVRDLGMAFDFAHATVEGANAWEMNFNLAQPHIGAVYFKDYKLNGKKWEACPIGEGVVNPLAGKIVSQKLAIDIPISIHIEYVTGGDVVGATVAAMNKDLATVREWIG
jgi:sugar phosphate isomerase/epimerase